MPGNADLVADYSTSWLSIVVVCVAGVAFGAVVALFMKWKQTYHVSSETPAWTCRRVLEWCKWSVQCLVYWLLSAKKNQDAPKKKQYSTVSDSAPTVTLDLEVFNFDEVVQVSTQEMAETVEGEDLAPADMSSNC